MKCYFLTPVLFFALLGTAIPSLHDEKPKEIAMKIRIEADGKMYTATLEDTKAARDFLTLSDYHATERIA